MKIKTTNYKEGDLLCYENDEPYKLFELEKTEMVYIEKGKFIMGQEYENPKEETIEEGYFIGKYLVTQELYIRITDLNPSFEKGKLRAIDNISWNDICNPENGFLPKLNKQIETNEEFKGTNFEFSLPTEAQWEYAALGGKKLPEINKLYGGSIILKDVAWQGFSFEKNHSMPVGIKQPNNLGIYDLLGIACQWCSNDYLQIFGKSIGLMDISKERNVFGNKVLRGGAIDDLSSISYRNANKPENFNFGLGFRLIMKSSKTI